MKRGISLLIMALMVVSLAACTKKATDNTAKTVKMEDIHKAVKDAYGENYLANASYDETMITEMFGINPDQYDEIIAEGPMITAHIDTFVAVHAKEGKVDEVETALKAYQDKLKADTLQYPMNQMKIQASKILKINNYVFFIQLGSLTNELEENGDEAALKEGYEKQNQLAVDAINKLFE